MSKARDYKPADIKRLFAFSGNQCAAPSCNRAIIAKDGTTVVGKICHIAAASSNGPRFDKTMEDDDRRAFDNLILLCDEDHSIIDNKENESKYPTPLLKQWKADHQAKFSSTPIEVSDKIVESAIEQVIQIEENRGIVNQLNGVYGNVTINNNLNNNYSEHYDESKEEGVIKEIFDNALNLVETDPIENRDKDNGKLIHALKKIQINFKTKEEEEEVRTYFSNSYNKKNSIEGYLIGLDSEFQLDLENHIFGKYVELKSTKPNIEILRDLFKLYIPNSKENDPMYTNMAQAYVLLFFEDCTIFEKTEEEISKQADLFSEL